jgi:hypothetical protein
MLRPKSMPLIPFYQNEKYSIILILAWPDTSIKNVPKWYGRIVDKISGSQSCKYRYGHSAYCIIERDGSISYTDFGRYMTSPGFGRARSAHTDPELTIPIRAKVKVNNKGEKIISNISEIIHYLGSHPNETHGEGRLVFSYNNAVSHKKINKHIQYIQDQHEIPYSPFSKKTTNCARFAASSISKGTKDPLVRLKLWLPELGTPIPVGVCIGGKSSLSKVWEYNTETRIISNSSYSRVSAGLEIIRNIFTPNNEDDASEIYISDSSIKKIYPHAQEIIGIGAKAHYLLEDCEALAVHEFRVRRFSNGKKDPDYDIIVACPSNSFSIQNDFIIQHASHKKRTRVQQNETIKDLLFVREYKNN